MATICLPAMFATAFVMVLVSSPLDTRTLGKSAEVLILELLLLVGCILYILLVPVTVVYTFMEVVDYIQMSRSVSGARRPTSWATNVERALPNEKRGVSIWRYYVTCSVLKALVRLDKGWQRLVRVFRGRGTGRQSDDDGGAIAI